MPAAASKLPQFVFTATAHWTVAAARKRPPNASNSIGHPRRAWLRCIKVIHEPAATSRLPMPEGSRHVREGFGEVRPLERPPD